MKIKLISVKDMRTKKPADLDKYILDINNSRADLLEQLQTSKEKSTHQLSQMKRSVAQAKTVKSELNAKENK